MILYHGTQDKNLKKLVINHNTGRCGDTENIYLTDSYACAFMYAASTLRAFQFDKQTDTLCVMEKAPNAFEKMYKGHGCLIFKIEIENPKKVEHPTGHVFSYNKDIVLDKENCDVIDDCYEKLLELEKEGKVKLQRWTDYTKEEQENVKNNFISRFKPYMEDEKKRFPEEYKLLVSFYPELKVEEKEDKKEAK